MSFVITDELSVMVTNITSRIGVYTSFTQSLLRGRNNGRSTDMTGQILPFYCPEFFVIIEMTGHFFSLEQLECLLEIPRKH